jgi:hypothetical protein
LAKASALLNSRVLKNPSTFFWEKILDGRIAIARREEVKALLDTAETSASWNASLVTIRASLRRRIVAAP